MGQSGEAANRARVDLRTRLNHPCILAYGAWAAGGGASGEAREAREAGEAGIAGKKKGESGGSASESRASGSSAGASGVGAMMKPAPRSVGVAPLPGKGALHLQSVRALAANSTQLLVRVQVREEGERRGRGGGETGERRGEKGRRGDGEKRESCTASFRSWA